MALKVQEFLRNGGTLEQLESQYGIVAKRGKYLWLVLLKYDIGSPMGEEIVQECRGLILDSVRNWDIVSFPYKKFFNHGEGHAAKIDWNTAKVFEKLDGSLCTLYWHQNEWHVSTSGTPDANCLINYTEKTFAMLFWEAWEKMGYCNPDNLLRDHCYMFELCAKENQVVVQHDELRLVLHGIREIGPESCYLEIPIEGYSNVFELAQTYSLTSMKECLDAAEQFNPIQHEGFVVVDGNFNRVKVKGLKYVALHHLRSDFSERRILDLVRLGEVPEVVSYFPEMGDKIQEIKGKYERIIEECASEFERASKEAAFSITDDYKVRRKKFAAIAGKSKYRSVLFAKYDNRDIKDFVDNLQVDGILNWIRDM